MLSIGYLSDNFGKTRPGKRFGRRRFFILLDVPLMLFYPFVWMDSDSGITLVPTSCSS